MSREEVIANIGTIAKSGTRELLQTLKESKSSDIATSLIGQFGVGFYSAFMVADRVTLVTRRAGEDTGTQWESTGDGTYSISEARRFTHGTSITLHLKKIRRGRVVEDFTQTSTSFESIVKKYSDFVTLSDSNQGKGRQGSRQAAQLDEADLDAPAFRGEGRRVQGVLQAHLA